MNHTSAGVRGPLPTVIVSALVGSLLTAGALWVSCARDAGRNARSGATADTTAAYSDPAIEDIVIARVGDEKITVRDLDTKTRVQFAQFRDLKGADAVHQKWEVLNSMFDQYLWCLAGEKNGLDREEEFQKTLDLSRRYILSNYTIRRLVHEGAQPSEEEARRYYEENEDQFRQAARANVDHILVASRAEAERLRARVQAGADFSELARSVSRDDVSRAGAGNLGIVGLQSQLRGFDAVYPQANQAIFATPDGGISEPVQTPRGWSLFRVRDKREGRVIPFDEAREGIAQKLSKSKAHEIYQGILDEVRRETRAAIDTAAWRDYAFRALGEEEVFRMAESEGRPDHRIGWFQAIAKRNSKGERAPQALFLAGFTCAEDLRDYRRARSFFEELLDRYPQNELAESARWMLANMEKGLENLPYADQLKRKAVGD